MLDSSPLGQGFSDRELEAAGWWVRHREQLIRLGHLMLILVVGLSWVFASWTFLDAYVISKPRERQISSVIINNERVRALLLQDAPQPLQTSPVAKLSSSGARTDFLVEVTNPNPQWWVSFRYNIRIGETKTVAEDGFLLPEAHRFLTSIGNTDIIDSNIEPQIEITDMEWHRLDPKVVGRDYAKYKDERLNLVFTSSTYTHDLQVGNQTIGQSAFTLENQSAYGLWNVPLTVILMRQGAPVAVSSINLAQLRAGEKRPLKLQWYDAPVDVSDTVVEANVNILHNRVFMSMEQ